MKNIGITQQRNIAKGIRSKHKKTVMGMPKTLIILSLVALAAVVATLYGLGFFQDSNKGNENKTSEARGSATAPAIVTHAVDANTGFAFGSQEIKDYYKQVRPGRGLITLTTDNSSSTPLEPTNINFLTFSELRNKLLTTGGVGVPSGIADDTKVALATFSGDFKVGGDNTNKPSPNSGASSFYHYSHLYEVFDGKTGVLMFSAGGAS
jgi:hypothetical protein